MTPAIEFDPVLPPVTTGRIRAALSLLWLVLLPVTGALYLTVQTSADQALLDYVAWHHTQGARSYSEVAAHSWPGELLLHELGVRAFGVRFWSFRLIDFLLVQLWTFGGFALLRRAGFQAAPYVMLAVYPVVYITAGAWMAGHRDILAMGALLWAAALTMPAGARPRRESIGMALAGAIAAYAFLVQPAYVTFVLILLVLEWLPLPLTRKKSASATARTLLLLVGFITPIVVIGGIGAYAGSLGNWYEQTVLLDAASSLEVPNGVLAGALFRLATQKWHWMTLLSLVGLLLWLYRRGVERGPAVVAGLAATFVLAFFMQSKDHLAGLLPVYVLLVAVCLELLFETATATEKPSYFFLAATALATLVTAAGVAQNVIWLVPHANQLRRGDFAPIDTDPRALPYDELRAIVDLIQAGSRHDEYVLQWGTDYQIGYLAQRRSSIRFISTRTLDSLTDRFDRTQAWLDEVQRDVRVNSPRFVVVGSDRVLGDSPPYTTPKNASTALRLLVEHLSNGYAVVKRFSTVTLYRRP